MLCKHNDCGWCYASELSKTNAKQGQCNEYNTCPEYITLKDGWNIECSMEPVPTDAVAHNNYEWPDEYEQSQHSAEEVIDEWNGEGLPPVGVECEVSVESRVFTATIEAYSRDETCVMWDFNDVIGCAVVDSCSFHPNKPLEQLEAQLRRESIQSMAGVFSGDSCIRPTYQALGVLYDAGYRLAEHKDGE